MTAPETALDKPTIDPSETQGSPDETPEPQHFTDLSPRRAQPNCAASAICSTPATPFTTAGRVLSPLASPSWPSLLRPQQRTEPSPISAHV